MYEGKRNLTVAELIQMLKSIENKDRIVFIKRSFAEDDLEIEEFVEDGPGGTQVKYMNTPDQDRYDFPVLLLYVE